MGLDMYFDYDGDNLFLRDVDLIANESGENDHWQSSYAGFGAFRGMLGSAVEIIENKQEMNFLGEHYEIIEMLTDQIHEEIPKGNTATIVSWNFNDVINIHNKSQACCSTALENHSDCDGKLIPFSFPPDSRQVQFQSAHAVYAELLMLEDSGLLSYWDKQHEEIAIAAKLTKDSELVDNMEWFIDKHYLLRKMCASSIDSGYAISFG